MTEKQIDRLVSVGSITGGAALGLLLAWIGFPVMLEHRPVSTLMARIIHG